MKKGVLGVLLFLCLVACQKQDIIENKKEAVKTTESTKTISASKISHNGIYYSVQGKFGEVIIVNKKHPVSPTYAPGEDPIALASFQKLIAAMQAEGFNVSDRYSGFRSYENQEAIYNGYLTTDSQANVDTYSARPGYSEHQTGLAFDVIDGAGQLLEEPIASKWLAENAHHYGFIVRYLLGKEASTGYMAESWHVRYIGEEAKDIYESGKTLEEYFNIPGGDYLD